MVGKQLVKVQGRSVLCYSFTDNTRHWYLNNHPRTGSGKIWRKVGREHILPTARLFHPGQLRLGTSPFGRRQPLCRILYQLSYLGKPQSLASISISELSEARGLLTPAHSYLPALSRFPFPCASMHFHMEHSHTPLCRRQTWNSSVFSLCCKSLVPKFLLEKHF